MTNPPETYLCPVDSCSVTDNVDALVRHIDDREDTDHTWAALGFTDSAEFRRVYPNQVRDPDARGIELPACQLTEFYEAFRGVKTVVDQAIDAEVTKVDPDDLSEPLVQYQRVISAFIGDPSFLPEEQVGYGPQHADRVEHSVSDYRGHHGNGDWITDYRAISVEPLTENTRTALADYGLVENPALLVRPVTPDTEIPVPEFISTQKGLQRALAILSRFPARPTIGPHESPTSERFPVQAVYEALLEGTDIQPVSFAESISQESDVDGEAGGREGIVPRWETSPAALTSPETEDEVEAFLRRYGKLTHLYRTVSPPDDTPIDRDIPVFSLDFYDPVGGSEDPSQHSLRIISLAKDEEDEFETHFTSRLRDFIYRRILKDACTYDFITVFPGHSAGSISSPLFDLAEQATVETPIVPVELLERTETTERQRTKDRQSRWDVARNPSQTLRVRHEMTDKSVIVLDDVVTSGGSLAAGAYLLRQAGATNVIGVTLGLTRRNITNEFRLVEDRELVASEIIESGL